MRRQGSFTWHILPIDLLGQFARRQLAHPPFKTVIDLGELSRNRVLALFE